MKMHFAHCTHRIAEMFHKKLKLRNASLEKTVSYIKSDGASSISQITVHALTLRCSIYLRRITLTSFDLKITSPIIIKLICKTLLQKRYFFLKHHNRSPSKNVTRETLLQIVPEQISFLSVNLARASEERIS